MKDANDSVANEVKTAMKTATDFTHVYPSSTQSNDVLLYRLEELVDMARMSEADNIDKFMLQFPSRIRTAVYDWISAAPFVPAFTKSPEEPNAANTVSDANAVEPVDAKLVDIKIRDEIKLCNFEHAIKRIIEELGRDFFTPVNECGTYIGSCDLEGIDGYVSSSCVPNSYIHPMLHDPNNCVGMNRLEVNVRMSLCSQHVDSVDVNCSPYVKLDNAETLTYSLPPWMLTDNAAKSVLDVRKYSAVANDHAEYLKYVKEKIEREHRSCRSVQV